MRHSSSRAAREHKRELLNLVRESESLTAQLEQSLEEHGWHLCAGGCGTRVDRKGMLCLVCYRSAA